MITATLPDNRPTTGTPFKTIVRLTRAASSSNLNSDSTTPTPTIPPTPPVPPNKLRRCRDCNNIILNRQPGARFCLTHLLLRRRRTKIAMYNRYRLAHQKEQVTLAKNKIQAHNISQGLPPYLSRDALEAGYVLVPAVITPVGIKNVWLKKECANYATCPYSRLDPACGWGDVFEDDIHTNPALIKGRNRTEPALILLCKDCYDNINPQSLTYNPNPYYIEYRVAKG